MCSPSPVIFLLLRPSSIPSLLVIAFMALSVRLLLPLSLTSLAQWTKPSRQTEQLSLDLPTSRLNSLQLWLNSSSPTRNSISLLSLLQLPSGNLTTLMPPLTTSMLPSLTSTTLRPQDLPIFLLVLISPSAQLPPSEVSISCLMVSPTLVFRLSQGSRPTSITRTLLSPTRFT